MRALRLLSILAVVAGSMLACTAAARSQTRTRPIEEFIAAQGTFCFPDPGGGPGCFLWVPPIANFLGWTDPAANASASVDFAGLAERWLVAHGASVGTTMDGTVVERPLKNGRAEVHVVLHTRNALTWAIQGFDFSALPAPLTFGNRAPQVLAGAVPALADCTLILDFVNTAPGAPMPDFQQLASFPLEGQAWQRVSFIATAKGPLHELSGSPEGASGILEVTQTGLLNSPANAGSRVKYDLFPAEHVLLRAVGK